MPHDAHVQDREMFLVLLAFVNRPPCRWLQDFGEDHPKIRPPKSDVIARRIG